MAQILPEEVGSKADVWPKEGSVSCPCAEHKAGKQHFQAHAFILCVLVLFPVIAAILTFCLAD